MTNVLLLGHGAIAHDLIRLLSPEISRGEVHICGAVVRDPSKHGDPAYPLYVAERLDEALAEADVVVECAGVAAAMAMGPRVIASGRDLILTSVGALAHEDARRDLLGGPGKLVVTNGAIGGFDALAAASQAGGVDEVTLRTSKLARALVQPWMSEAEAERLEMLTEADGPLELFVGTPTEAIKKFPSNVNVSVALAWATQDLLPKDASLADRVANLERALERVQVSIVADAAATLSEHLIRTSGRAGTCEFHFLNAPSPTNPRTSGFTAMSVARDLREWLRG